MDRRKSHIRVSLPWQHTAWGVGCCSADAVPTGAAWRMCTVPEFRPRESAMTSWPRPAAMLFGLGRQLGASRSLSPAARLDAPRMSRMANVPG